MFEPIFKNLYIHNYTVHYFSVNKQLSFINIGVKNGYGHGNMYGTQLQFNPKKRLTLYDQNGKRWCNFGSRQSKRQQSQKANHGKELTNI